MIAHLRVQPEKGAAHHVRWHIVWDRDRFVAAQRAEVEPKGGSVEVISEQEYRDCKWPDAPGKTKESKA